MSRLHKMAALTLAVGIMSGTTFLLFAQKAPAPGDKVVMSPGVQSADVPAPDRKNVPSPDAAPGNAPKEAADRAFDFNAMSTKRDPFKSLIKKNEVVVDASP